MAGTGFPGSGKTRLPRHVPRHPAFASAAVLIDEFGEVPPFRRMIMDATGLADPPDGCRRPGDPARGPPAQP